MKLTLWMVPAAGVATVAAVASLAFVPFRLPDPPPQLTDAELYARKTQELEQSFNDNMKASAALREAGKIHQAITKVNQASRDSAVLVCLKVRDAQRMPFAEAMAICKQAG